jgi:hypothetical protein
MDGAGTRTPYRSAELETGKRNSWRLPLRCGGHERCSMNRSDGKEKTGCAPSDELSEEPEQESPGAQRAERQGWSEDAGLADKNEHKLIQALEHEISSRKEENPVGRS